MFFKDKYKPVYFSDYIIHKNIVSKLYNIIEDPTNLLITGIEGIGKSTIIDSFINEIFKKKIEIQKKTFKIKNNNTTKDIDVDCSAYHFEINLTKYSILNNRTYLCELIKLLVKYKEINGVSPYTILVIKNAHHINHPLTYIKNFIEKTPSLRIMITTCSVTNNLCVIRPFFTSINLKLPNNKELTDLCNNIILEENTKKLNKNLLKEIIKEQNIVSILIKLEIILLNKSNYIDPVKKDIDNLYDLIVNFNLNNILKLREQIYSMISKNIDVDIITKYLYKKILSNKNIDLKKKIVITSLFAKYDARIKNSFKNIVHLETLLITLLKIINEK